MSEPSRPEESQTPENSDTPGDPQTPEDSHAARRVILLVLLTLMAGLLVVALMTNARTPSGDSNPSITASPVPVGGGG